MPVRFSEAITLLLEDQDKIFLEVGPRNVLTTLARQHTDQAKRALITPSLGSTAEDDAEW